MLAKFDVDSGLDIDETSNDEQHDDAHHHDKTYKEDGEVDDADDQRCKVYFGRYLKSVKSTSSKTSLNLLFAPFGQVIIFLYIF